MFLSFLFSWFVIEVLTFQNFGSDVTDVAFHPTKNLVASCSYDKSVKLWNADTGAELWTVNVGSWVNRVHCSPDGHTVAAGCRNGVQIIDVATAEVKRPLNVGYVLFSLDLVLEFRYWFLFSLDLVLEFRYKFTVKS